MEHTLWRPSRDGKGPAGKHGAVRQAYAFGDIVSQQKRRHFRRGVYVACTLILGLAIIFIVGMGFSYDGKCGGFFPGLSGRKACSLSAYMLGDVMAMSLIMVFAYWPVVLTLLILPPIVGYWLDRKG